MFVTFYSQARVIINWVTSRPYLQADPRRPSTQIHFIPRLLVTHPWEIETRIRPPEMLIESTETFVEAV